MDDTHVHQLKIIEALRGEIQDLRDRFGEPDRRFALCKSCLWFARSNSRVVDMNGKDSFGGTCRRWAPGIDSMQGRKGRRRMPDVGLDDWCGEFGSLSQKDDAAATEPPA